MVRAASIVDFFLLADLGFRIQYYTKLAQVGLCTSCHCQMGMKKTLFITLAELQKARGVTGLCTSTNLLIWSCEKLELIRISLDDECPRCDMVSGDVGKSIDIPLEISNLINFQRCEFRFSKLSLKVVQIVV
ncbi:unnamed protein product [Fraxinus pennsylvanica]|uniref:Uncharacterized protein n=1 Tax=Fraxinus pennsylvanica TaxID=56036 RepID=A0AAD1ZEQ2_9LAMI|nr:unnamed protein product [Fraxinus pennsylvanica]